MANIKNGAVAKSDRDKYREMAVPKDSVLAIPGVLAEHFKKEGLAYKWISKGKIAKHGGYHPSGWFPYELSDEQKAHLPKVYLGNVISNCLERGDLILAVKPEEFQAQHRKDINRRTQAQLDAYYQEKDAKGKPILRDEE